MHLTDVKQLRDIFDGLDQDKSDSIDEFELGVALGKTGKKPSEYEAGLKAVIQHYGKADAKGKWCEPDLILSYLI